MTSQTTLGTTIGRHRIARLLGGGTLGRVFACKSPEREQLVAIKLLRSKYAALGESLVKQRNALEQIDSPHTVKIHDVAVFNNLVYVVMDLIEGESLAERLKKGMMRTVDSLALARAVVLGLQAGWAHGIAHGDLRPANVLLPNGHIQSAKLVDFQLAVPVDGTESVRGAPPYLAPELLVGTPCDALTDLYAVGCLLHEVLTGRPPFSGSAGSVLHAQANTKPPTLAATMPGAPQGLVDLVDRLLEKDRAKRVKTHGEALAGIERALSGQGMAPARGLDIPSYDVDVEIEGESFDYERTAEFHTSPARENLERMFTPPARPAFTGTLPSSAPAAGPAAGRATKPSAPAPAPIGIDNAPTQVKPVPAGIPQFAPLPPLPPLPSSSAPKPGADKREPSRSMPVSPAPMSPAPSSSGIAVSPVDGGVGVYRSGTGTAQKQPHAIDDEEVNIDIDDEHTRVDATIAPPIPSADDVGLVLTPIEDEEER